MKTNKTKVTNDVSVWATPKPAYVLSAERESDPHTLPYTLTLNTHTIWNDGAVKLHTVPVTIILPDGIDIVSQAIETLSECRKIKVKEYEDEIAIIDEKIASLAVLEYKPD